MSHLMYSERSKKYEGDAPVKSLLNKKLDKTKSYALGERDDVLDKKTNKSNLTGIAKRRALDKIKSK